MVTHLHILPKAQSCVELYLSATCTETGSPSYFYRVLERKRKGYMQQLFCTQQGSDSCTCTATSSLTHCMLRCSLLCSPEISKLLLVLWPSLLNDFLSTEKRRDNSCVTMDITRSGRGLFHGREKHGFLSVASFSTADFSCTVHSIVTVKFSLCLSKCHTMKTYW